MSIGVADFSLVQIQGLTTSQINQLSDNQINSLSETKLGWLTDNQTQSFSKSQIEAIDADKMDAFIFSNTTSPPQQPFTPGQIRQMNNEQLEALSPQFDNMSNENQNAFLDGVIDSEPEVLSNAAIIGIIIIALALIILFMSYDENQNKSQSNSQQPEPDQDKEQETIGI